MCNFANFHTDLLLDTRYATVFAVAAGMMPGERAVLLTGEQKVALGFVVDTGDPLLDDADPVPVDDWLFAWLDQRPEDGPVWYVFEGGTEDNTPRLAGYKFMDSCQCWRPRVIFDMVDGSVDDCEWVWSPTHGEELAGVGPKTIGFATPESASKLSAEEESLLAVVELVEPTADVNDR